MCVENSDEPRSIARIERIDGVAEMQILDESGPARESVLARDDELRASELDALQECRGVVLRMVLSKSSQRLLAAAPGRLQQLLRLPLVLIDVDAAWCFHDSSFPGACAPRLFVR
jgi:hypothetical protein